MEKDKADGFWRFMMFFPILINLVMLGNYFLAINSESIMFSLSQGDDEEAMKLIKKIYKKDHEAVLQKLKD